jgi:hypothetical protein
VPQVQRLATQAPEGGAIVKTISTPITGAKATALQLKLLKHHPGSEVWVKVDNNQPYRCVITEDWGLDATQAVNPKDANGNPKVYPEDGNKIWEATGQRYNDGVAHFQQQARQGHQIFVIPNRVEGGIRAADVQQCQHIFAEADDRPIPEQWERLQWFSDVTGLVPCLVIYSGGKSLHFYFSLTSAIRPEDWQRLQRKIILIFRSDPQIQNLNREMRLAGVTRKDKQVSVDFTSDHSYDPIEFEQRLDSLGYFPHGLIYERWLKARKLLKDKVPDAELLKLLATPEDELFPKEAPRPQPSREFNYTGNTIPLEFCLTRDDQELIAHGVSAGSVGRNPMGYKLACNAIGTAAALNQLGIRHLNNGYQLLEEFCRRCNPPLPDREIQRLWMQAQKSSPKASLTDEQLLKRVSYWQWTQLPPAEKGKRYTKTRQKLDKNSAHTIARDQWEVKFGFGKRLKERVKRALEGFKGFGKPPAPKPNIAPNDLFQDANQRLQVWQNAVNQGYKYILDTSAPGLGKSHTAGITLPEAFSVEKLWYLSPDHRNPTTGVIESNYVDLTVRHNGLKIDDSRKTPNGNPFLVWPKAGEEPDTKGNCFKADLFQKFRAKNLNVETAEDSPICQTCKLAHLCKNGSGQKYGASFRGDRKNALAFPKIRAHADSMPNPGDFDYSISGIIWDEAGTQLKPMDSVDVTLADFDQTWALLEGKAPDLHEQLKPLRLTSRPLLTGEVKQPFHGWDDALIRALLPEKPSNLDAIISELEEILQPDLSFLEETPDSISPIEAKELGISKAQQQLVNRHFRSQAHERFNDAFQQLALNWLVPFLKVWNGERGAFRCEWQHLTIFTKSDRHTSVARSAKFNVFLDATIDRERLAILLGVDPSEIYVVGQETPNHGNLKIVQAIGLGKLGKDRSDSLKERIAALRKALEERYPGLVFGDWKSHAQTGDGQWFVNLRGSNEFQHVPALAVFGVPYQNIGYLQALYQTLTGEFAPLDRGNPHEGLQQFIEAHTQAEIEQGVGRLRAHLRPNEHLTFVFVGDYDLSFLRLPVEQVEAFQICPEAGTDAQITRWKILEAVRTLKSQGEKLTQDAIATFAEVSQPLISKIASQFGGWKQLSKLLLALLDPFYSGSNNFLELTDEEKWLAQTYLPGLLDESQEAAVQEIGTVVQVYGISAFLRIMIAATPQTQARLLALVIQALPANFQSELVALIEGSGAT